MINSIISLSKIKLSWRKTYFIFILVFIYQLMMLKKNQKTKKKQLKKTS